MREFKGEQKIKGIEKMERLPLTLQPKEQNLNESRRLRQQISQVLVTPLPGRGCGRSLRKTIFALLMMYV